MMVHDAAEQQALQALKSLGLNASADVALLTVTLIHSVDESPISSGELNEYGLEDAAIVVHTLFTSPEAWYIYMAGLIRGVPGASLAYVDWPLVLSPCLPEAYLFDAVRVEQNGSTTVSCKPRQICILGETFASWAGNRTTDRVCQPTQACEYGERRPASLTTDRLCESPSQNEADLGMVGSIVGLVVVMLVLVLVLVIIVYRRRRVAQHRKAAMPGPPLDQFFVNPTFVGRIDCQRGLENSLYAKNDVQNMLYSVLNGWEDNDGGLYCDFDEFGGISGLRDARKAAEDEMPSGSRASRRHRSHGVVIRNPLYDEGDDDDTIDSLYDDAKHDDGGLYCDVDELEGISGLRDARKAAEDKMPNGSRASRRHRSHGVVIRIPLSDEGGDDDTIESLYDDAAGVIPGSAAIGYFDVHPDMYTKVADVQENADSYLDVTSDDEDDVSYFDVTVDAVGEPGKYRDANPSPLMTSSAYFDVKPRLEEHGANMDATNEECAQYDRLARKGIKPRLEEHGDHINSAKEDTHYDRLVGKGIKPGLEKKHSSYVDATNGDAHYDRLAHKGIKPRLEKCGSHMDERDVI
jgi:hypothetical protein